jgi:hypothetical protein
VNYCPLCPRRPRAPDRARSSSIPGEAPDLEPSGFDQGLPEGSPLGALDEFRSAQTMICAGDGTPDRHITVSFRSFMPGAGRWCRIRAGRGRWA